MTVRRIVTNIAADDVDGVAGFYATLFGLRKVMDHGWIVTLAGAEGAPVQLSIASEGGSGTPVPDVSIEVEDVLFKHPAVAMVAVVAKEDEKWGETPCAFIELKPGSDASEADIIEFCQSNLARFKCPRHVIFGELPKTSTGKVQKFVLRDLANRQ